MSQECKALDGVNQVEIESKLVGISIRLSRFLQWYRLRRQYCPCKSKSIALGSARLIELATCVGGICVGGQGCVCLALTHKPVTALN